MRKSFKKRSNQILSVFVLLPFIAQTFVTPLLALDEVLPEIQVEEDISETEVDIPIDTSEDILEEGISDPEEIAKPIWVTTEGSATTFSPVVLGEKYVYPHNSDVTVVFSSLPEVSGTLTIKTVYLTDEQVEVTNAASNVAFDITTDMVDGTFNYDLTLPKVGESNTVVYAESVNELVNAKDITNVIDNESSLKIEDLDHFTVFVVTFEESQNPLPATPGYNDEWFDWGGSINQVASGTNGITSAKGSYHAQITGSDGAFTRYGKYRNTFPTNGYDTRVDVYLDMALATGNTTDKRFDYSSAISDTAGNHRRDFIFSLGTDPNISGQWLVSASNNAPGWPGDPNKSPVNITETGWYTLEHQFRKNASNQLVVTLNIYKKGVTNPIGTWTLTNPSDIIGNPVGGNRYGWFINTSQFAWLAIDNSELVEVSDPCPNIINTKTGTTYCTIQKAIDDATSGDTINVADGIYKENLTIGKSITLKSINETTSPKIDGSLDLSSAAIKITANNVKVQGFTIQNASNSYGGIYLYNSTESVIEGNTFSDNGIDIWIDGGSGSTIEENTLYGDYSDPKNGIFGIALSNSSGNKIFQNTITGKTYSMYGAIYLEFSNSNEISGNNLTNNLTKEGIQLYSSNYNTISGNTIENNNNAPDGRNVVYGSGIKLYSSSNNQLLGNNISKENMGISFVNGSNNNEVKNNNTLTNNYKGVVIYCADNGNAHNTGNTIQENNIYGNHFADNFTNSNTGILFQGDNCSSGTGNLNATKNWWGDASGPHADNNTSGLGNSVSSYVDYRPWYIDQSRQTLSSANAITKGADSITQTDALLNGTNGSYDAAGHSFWVSLTPFETTSPNIPSGVYSTPDFGSINANEDFSASLSSITTTGIPGNLPAITQNTTYYYVAWSLVDNIWYPGEIKSFTTLPISTPTATLTANNITVPDNGYTNSYTFTFNLSSSEDATRYQLKYWNDIVGSPFKENTPWNPTNLSGYSNNVLGVYNDKFTQGEGKHYFAFSACDVVGNCSAYSDPFVVTYDHSAPEVEITSHNDGELVHGTITITGEISDENLSHYWFVVADSEGNTVAGPGQDNSLPASFTWNTLVDVDDGEYTIKLEARDLAGNKDPNESPVISDPETDGDSVDWITVIVDNTAPVIEDHDDMTLVEGDALPTDTLALSDDNPSQFCVKVTDSTGTLGTSDYTCVDIDSSNLTGDQFAFANAIKNAIEDWKGTFDYIDLNVLPEGQYRIDYYATDLAGNTSDPSTFVVAIEDNIPTVTVTPTSPEVTQGGEAVVLSASVTNGNAPYTYQWTGACTGTDAQTTFNPTTEGEYTCTVTVTDADGDTTTSQSTVIVGAALGATDEKTPTTGEVQGATTGPTPKKSPIYYAQATNTNDIEEENTTDETEMEVETNEEEVLGETTCEATYKISGTVYYDKNNNGKYDEDEKVVEGIEVNIYNDKDELVKTVTTDDKGYWEVSLCPGEYTTQVEGAEDQSVVLGDSDTTLDISVKEPTNWLLIVLIGLAVLILLGVIVDRSKKKKEI